jgi:hypothetical protein
MSSLLEQALGAVGVTPDTNGAIGAALGLTKALTDFGSANNGLPTTGIGGAFRDIIESNIPPIFRTNPTPGGVKFEPRKGEWTALHYADDLVAHHPKFKFIFKVKFQGFEGMGNSDFYYYVHRCDKPNITFEHQDVNYYNFRSRVLTKTIFQPISMTLLDEVGNSVNDFFVKYMLTMSGQANGKSGIDSGFGEASSTNPYKRGYSGGKAIIVNQIFANGLYTNEFKFINPRIESFQFDELNMEDNAGSLLTLQFTYDSIAMNTYAVGPEGSNGEGLYTWGQTDILKGGGTSGFPNAGATSFGEGVRQAAQSASGNSLIGGLGLSKFSDTVNQVVSAGVSQLQELPKSLQGVLPSFDSISASAKSAVDSSASTLSRDISDTLSSLQTGKNFNTATISSLTSKVAGFSSAFAPTKSTRNG